jgi:threonylcarbamoyladenosine tRNA methylthiotransferase MtaB
MSQTLQIITLGCKVNQAESEALAAGFVREKNWKTASSGDYADLCIVNTCAVTQKAAMQSRQAIRKAVRSHPGAMILVTGCYAQNDPETIAGIKGVDYVVGQGEKHRIMEIVTSAPGLHAHSLLPATRSGPVIRHTDISQHRDFDPMPVPIAGRLRTRPFLKIQDGCDCFCT